MFSKDGDLFSLGLVITGFVLLFVQTSRADDPKQEIFSDGDKNYLVFYYGRKWYGSQRVCKRFDGNLVSFHDKDTMARVLKKVNDPHEAWIGLNDHDNDKVFTWIDESPLNFTNWASGEPNSNGNERCVTVYLSVHRQVLYEWNDQSCNERRIFICSLPPPRVRDHCDEPGWISFENSCYYFSVNKQRWKQAGRFCQSKDANLVSILSSSENLFISEQLKALRDPTEAFWIGMRSTKWSDGSVMAFENWRPNEPNVHLGDDGCAGINTIYGNWYNEDCDLEYGYICKKHNASMPSIFPGANKTKTSSGACPENFFSVGHTDKCLYLGGTDGQKREWAESVKECSSIRWSQNVTLASIGSQLEHDVATMLLSQLTDDGDVWIGLYSGPRSDSSTGRTYHWNNSEAVTFALWSEGQPGNDNQCNGINNCVSASGNFTQGTDLGKWSVGLCFNRNSYLCQTTKDNNKTSTGSLTTLPGSSSSTTCPDGYNWFKSACFSVKTETATWEDARARCQNEGGDLASMLDASDVANINYNIYLLNNTEVQYWIGLRYQNESFKYVWTDGSQMSRDFWQDGQPNMYHETDKCVAFKGGFWDDRPCGETKPYVCQQRTGKGAAPKPKTYSKAIPCTNISAYDGNCYVAKPDDIKSWTEAVEACNALGMQLVSLHSVDETSFIQSLVNGQAGNDWSVWTGLVNNVGGFRWADRSPFNFEHWADRNPTFTWNDEEVECVEMSRNGYWRDDPCRTLHGYVCKAPQVPVVIPIPISIPEPVPPTVDDSEPSAPGLTNELVLSREVILGIVAVVLICAAAVGAFVVLRKRLRLKRHSTENIQIPTFRTNTGESE